MRINDIKQQDLTELIDTVYDSLAKSKLGSIYLIHHDDISKRSLNTFSCQVFSLILTSLIKEYSFTNCNGDVLDS